MSESVDKKLNLSAEALKTFAQRIKELREERNFSMMQLSKYIGFSRSAISMYETERRSPDIKVLMTYSEFFDVPVDYLLGKTNLRKPLYQVACFSDISTNDFGKLSKGAQKDIKNFIEKVMEQEKRNKLK